MKPDCYVDYACVVPGGRKHHEHLRKESFVAYSFAVIELASYLVSKADKSILKPLEPMSDDLLLRIGKGVTKSDRVASKYRAYFKAYTGG